jgi:glycosyltransferase involved in cell wall biosynthesis
MLETYFPRNENYEETMRIHILSDSPKSNSGFCNVCKNLAMGLKELKHDVSISGFQTTFLEYYNGLPVYPMATGLDEIEQLQNNIMKVRPEVVMYVNDGYTDARKFLTVFPRTISYTPIEGFDIPNHMVQNLNKVAKNGLVVSQCEYGYQEMKKAGINVHSYIYHGFNQNIFYPIDITNIDLESRYCYYNTDEGKDNIDPRNLCQRGCNYCKLHIPDQINCKWYKEETVTISKYDNKEKRWLQIEGIPVSKLKENINPSKKFIFLGVVANHMLRKKLERLLKAHSILIESKQLADRIHLHLHSNPISPTGIDLLVIANRLNIQNNISFSYGNWSENALNILYNLADVGVSASSSEGYGMDTLQSMATGNPYIAPNCTSFTELIDKIIADPSCENNTIGPRGLLAKIEANYMLQDLTYRSLVDEIDLATKMKQIYSDKKLREKYGENSINFAKNFTWKKICEQWNDTIAKML